MNNISYNDVVIELYHNIRWDIWIKILSSRYLQY